MTASIKVLFLAATPLDHSNLTLSEEIRRIELCIRLAEFRNSLTLIPRLAARADDVQQALLEIKPHVVHFSGHGNGSEIMLLGEDGLAHPVSGEVLTDLFRILRHNLRLVVLNACFSQAQARAISKHIDVAIGMRHEIGDEAARAFVAPLYRALAFGESVRTAFDLGKNALGAVSTADDSMPELIHRPDVDPRNVILIQPEPEVTTPPSLPNHSQTSMAPARSPATANTFSIESFADHQSPSVGKVTSPAFPAFTPSALPRRRRSPGWLVGLGLLGLIVIAVAAATSWRRTSDRAATRSHVAERPLRDQHIAMQPRDGIRALLESQAAAMTNGNREAYLSTFHRDAFSFGANAADAGTGLQQMSSRFNYFLTASRLAIHSSNVALSPDEESAWVEQNLSITVLRQEKENRIIWTQLIVFDGEKWLSLASHWAHAIPNRRAFKAAEAGTLPALKPLQASIAPKAEKYATMTRMALKPKSGGFYRLFSSRPDVIVWGSSPEERYLGASALKWAKRLSNSLELSGPLQAATAPNGNVGWLAANVSLLGRKNRNQSLAYRLLMIFVLQNDEWKAVLAHFSNGEPVP